MSHTSKPRNGSVSKTSERTRIIAFLRYALDDVDAISRRSADYLRMAIECLEEEERMDVQVLDVHDVRGR